jgi:hypothetical protein
MMRTLNNKQGHRKVWWQPFALIISLLVLAWAVGPVIPIGSPRRMVKNLATQGEPIVPVPNRAPSNSPVTDATPAAKAPTPALISPVSEKPSAASSQHYRQVTFTQLSGFQFQVTDDLVNPPTDVADANQKVREQIPDAVWKLNDKDVALTGYMLPVQLKDGLATDFMLLPNQMTCCYGVKPRINEWIIVRTAGKGVKPKMDTLITAEGTLHVGAQRENGSLTGIYQLDLDQLKTANN